MSEQKVTIFQSWKLSFSKEIIAEIQHSFDGLLPDTILTATERGLKWKVISRILFIQFENHLRFKGEKIKFEHLSFQHPKIDYYEKFKRDISEKEGSKIFQYSIEPLGHELKPLVGEQLDITW